MMIYCTYTLLDFDFASSHGSFQVNGMCWEVWWWSCGCVPEGGTDDCTVYRTAYCVECVQSTLRAARAHNKPAPSRYLTHPYLCKVECDVVCCVVGSCVKRTTTTHNKTRLIVLPYHPTNHNRFFFFFLYVLDIIVKLPSSCRTYYLL